MADSDKGDSSTKEAKAKASLLDDDFSKDFLSSWKSMSATGGDDMDFNFEPVNKGKKKAFDFGMDMDFSLDDAFGKMSSFKIDMPDLDFSSSPKKPSKTKENSEEHSAKGNRADKHDNFAFSFDFNGLDDFNLDAPSTKREKSTSSEKKNKNNDSELEDFPIRVAIDKKETAEVSISKGPEVCEDVAFSKTEDFAVDIPSVSCALKSTAISCPVQETELDKNQISSDKKLVDNNSHKTDHQSHNNGEASSKKSCSPGREGILDPISSDKPAQSIEVYMSSETENTMTSLSTEDEILQKEEKCSTQSHTQLKEMDLPSNTPLVKASVQANDSEGLEIRSPERKLNNGSSEGGSIAEEIPAAVDLTPATEKPITDESSLECSTDKMNINYGNNDIGNSDNMGRAKLILGTVDPYATRDTKALSTSARSSAETQNPVLKVSSAPIGSGTNAAKAMLMRNKVPGTMNSKFTVTQATEDGGRKELSAYEDNKESSTNICAADRSISVSCNSSGDSKHHEKKSDDNSSSCTKELIKPDSGLEKTEKIAVAHSPPRDQEGIVIWKDRGEMNFNTVQLPNGKEARNRLSSLEYENMNNNVKSSGFKNPTRTAPEEGIQSGNQGQGKYKDKISSMSSIKKLNIGQGNKPSSQRTENKMLALPTLKLASAATDKQLTTPAKQRNFGSLGNFEKSTRLQAAIKMVSPVSAEKQTLPTFSLKRKPSVDADMGPAKLHSPKRVSPNESRISKASPKEHEDRDQTKGNFLEGSGKNVSVEYTSPKFDFDQEANIEALKFSMMVENDENVEKAEACAKELDNMCNMLKKKHEEAKELLVRALMNNNYLLMLNHPIYEEKIRAVLRLASRLTTKELEVEA